MKQGTSPAFRTGRSADVPAVARLALHSFPRLGYDLPRWESWLTDFPRGGVETLWVGEEAGDIVAACRLYRLEQWIAGTRIPVMGLGLVTISAAHRRRGSGSELVGTALREATDRGYLATALFPFRTSFYQRLGYGMAGDAFQYIVPPSAFPDHPERSNVRIVETAAERALVADVYARWAPTQTGQVARADRDWELVWQDGARHGVLCRVGDAEPTGYAVFQYLPEPVRGGYAVQIEEIAWLDDAARRALHGWLGSLGDQWARIVYSAHPDEGFAERLRELRYPTDGIRWSGWFPSCTVMSGPMFRLLDVGGAWAARRASPDLQATLNLVVSDARIPENGGEWTLRMEDGRIDVTRGHAASAEVTLRTSIEALSRIYIGAVSPSRSVAIGIAEADSDHHIHRIDRLLHVPRPWTFDRF